MKIGIITNKEKKDGMKYVDQISLVATKYGAQVFNSYDSAKELCDYCDLIITIGGDGTFLRAASHALLKEIPVLGFNLGTLGMLTEFDKNNIESSLQKVISGNYFIEERSALDIKVINEQNEIVCKGLAINDCVLSREPNGKMIYVQFDINNNLVERYPCDGIIISTQTGSTAYSLAAGGPIIEPGNDIIMVTPICPHFTDGRSVVARGSSEIKLHLIKNHDPVSFSIDGTEKYKLEYGDSIFCTLSNIKLKVVRLSKPDFFGKLKVKINEREEKLKNNEI